MAPVSPPLGHPSLSAAALHAAAANGHATIAKSLIDTRAAVNVVSENGFTPLHAAADGHPGVVQLLLEARADPGKLDGLGESAASFAKQEEHRCTLLGLGLGIGAHDNLGD